MEATKFTLDKAQLDQYINEEKEWNRVAIFDNKGNIITKKNTEIKKEEIEFK